MYAARPEGSGVLRGAVLVCLVRKCLPRTANKRQLCNATKPLVRGVASAVSGRRRFSRRAASGDRLLLDDSVVQGILPAPGRISCFVSSRLIADWLVVIVVVAVVAGFFKR